MEPVEKYTMIEVVQENYYHSETVAFVWDYQLALRICEMHSNAHINWVKVELGEIINMGAMPKE